MAGRAACLAVAVTTHLPAGGRGYGPLLRTPGSLAFSLAGLVGRMPISMLGIGTVLLVEDNPDVATASTNLLEQLGYTVRRVANAEAALREIELDGIDLVFSDIVMPGEMDGLSFARHLKTIRPKLPILLATGYSDAAIDVRDEFPILRKPYEIHQLSQAIAKLPK